MMPLLRALSQLLWSLLTTVAEWVYVEIRGILGYEDLPPTTPLFQRIVQNSMAKPLRTRNAVENRNTSLWDMPSKVVNMKNTTVYDASAAWIYNKTRQPTPAGYRYEAQVLALVFLRCLKERLIFLLSANNGDAGKFEDVALVWRRKEQHKARILIVQVKHTDTVIEREALRSETRNPDFALPIYCTSYDKLCKKQEIVTCVLLTNGSLEESKSTHYMFTREDVGNVPGLELIEAGGVLYKINTSSKHVPEEVRENTAFVQNFYLLCKQRDCKEIEGNICLELKQLRRAGELSGRISNKLYKDLCNDLCKSFREWMGTRSECVTSGWTDWQALVVKYSSKMDKVATTLGYRCVEEVWEHMKAHNPAWVKPPEMGTEALSATKIQQALSGEKHVMVRVERYKELRDRILHSWGQSFRWLVAVSLISAGMSIETLKRIAETAPMLHYTVRIFLLTYCKESFEEETAFQKFMDVQVEHMPKIVHEFKQRYIPHGGPISPP